MRHIAIVSIPTAGHIKTLLRLCDSIEDSEIKFTFILTSWLGYEINPFDLQQLKKHQLIILKASNAIKRDDTYARALELTDAVIENCWGLDEVIYDFMTPEGYIAAQVLSLPTYCANPTFFGPVASDNLLLKKNLDAIVNLENKYDVEIHKHLQLMSNHLSVQAPLNLVFSWQKFLVSSPKFFHHREQYRYVFMRPANTKKELNEFQYIKEAKQQNKKVIFFSLGTIATGPAWDMSQNTLHQFIKTIYQYLLAIAARRDDVIFVIATGRKVDDIITTHNIPVNVHIYESVPQVQLLSLVDLFITHCGANGANEAIDSEVPMIAIPLMFDQHECAARVSDLGIGIAFQHPPKVQAEAANLRADIYFRESLNEESLEQAIDKILTTSDYKNNYKLLKQDNSTRVFQDMAEILEPFCKNRAGMKLK